MTAANSAAPSRSTTGTSPVTSTRRSMARARRDTASCSPRARAARSTPRAVAEMTSDSAKTVHMAWTGWALADARPAATSSSNE